MGKERKDIWFPPMRYEPITEKPSCCVPAVLQMVLKRRGLPCMTQDEIGWTWD